MEKILNYHQLKELDAWTIANEPVTSISLMERACNLFVDKLNSLISTSSKVGVVCGTGNNGGDGLAIARLLIDSGYQVEVWIIRGRTTESPEFKANLGRLPITGNFISSIDKTNLFSEADILIDAIFGIGLNRPLEGVFAEIVGMINSCSAKIIAVEIPSGLLIDRHSSGNIVVADYTISFHVPKLSFLLPENNKYIGRWQCVDIGLSQSFIEALKSSHFWITNSSVADLITPFSTFDHKGTHGRALIIAGSYGKMGACILATKAALRSGIGLITVNTPKSGYNIIQVSVPEAMVVADDEEKIWSANPFVDLNSFDAVGVGPGIGQDQITSEAFLKILKSKRPLLIDADAINILSKHRDWIHLIPEGSILSPHPGEFERLVGEWKDDFERLELQIRLAKEANAVVILKGAYSSIATPSGEVFFNSTGNPGMGTGGSGDALTGVLTSMLALGYSSIHASIIGVYLHGLAGDLAGKEKGYHSLIATDIIDFLPKAFLECQSVNQHLNNQ